MARWPFPTLPPRSAGLQQLLLVQIVCSQGLWAPEDGQRARGRGSGLGLGGPHCGPIRPNRPASCSEPLGKAPDRQLPEHPIHTLWGARSSELHRPHLILAAAVRALGGPWALRGQQGGQVRGDTGRAGRAGLWAQAALPLPAPSPGPPAPRVQVEFYVNENTFKERLKLFFIKNQRSSEWGPRAAWGAQGRRGCSSQPHATFHVGDGETPWGPAPSWTPGWPQRHRLSPPPPALGGPPLPGGPPPPAFPVGARPPRCERGHRAGARGPGPSGLSGSPNPTPGGSAPCRAAQGRPVRAEGVEPLRDQPSLPTMQSPGSAGGQPGCPGPGREAGVWAGTPAGGALTPAPPPQA